MFVLEETKFDVAMKRRQTQMEIQSGAGAKKRYLIRFSEVLDIVINLILGFLICLMIGIGLLNAAWTVVAVRNGYGVYLTPGQHNGAEQDKPFIRHTEYIEYRR